MWGWLRKFWSKSPTRRVRASYDAAQTTEENQRHWRWADGLSAKTANDLGVRKTLRDRARYEVANNSYARGLLSSLASDFGGLGPKLQIHTQDAIINTRIEKVFHEWARAIDLADKLRIAHQAKKVDGEAFGLFTTNDRLTHPIKLDIVLVECDQVTSPRAIIPTEENGNLNIDGVIIDRFGNVVGYEILVNHPGDYYPSYESRLHDSRHVFHWFRSDRPGQVRGVSEFTASLPLFAQLRRYTLATLSAAEVAANFALMLETDAPADGADEDPNPMATMEVDRGIMTAVPAGWTAKQLSAEQPTTTYAMFKDELLKEMGRGFNAPHNITTGDSSNYNFSSARMDSLIYRSGIKVERHHAEQRILEPMFHLWLQEALLIPGLIPREFRGLPHAWVWPGFEYMDPQVEAAAELQRLTNGTTTLAAVLAERGLNFEDVIQTRAREKQALESLGLPVPGVAAPEPTMEAATRRLSIRAYDPDQERDESGQWTSDGASGGSSGGSNGGRGQHGTSTPNRGSIRRENAASRREDSRYIREKSRREKQYQRDDATTKKTRQVEDQKLQQSRKREDSGISRERKKEDAAIQRERSKKDKETLKKRQTADKALARQRAKDDAQRPNGKPSRKTVRERERADTERGAAREREDLRTQSRREAEDVATQSRRDTEDTARNTARQTEDAARKNQRYDEDRRTTTAREHTEASERNRYLDRKKSAIAEVRKAKAISRTLPILAYDDDQPRDDSGQWTDGGGGDSDGDDVASTRADEDADISSARADEDADISSARADEDADISSTRTQADAETQARRESEDADIASARADEDAAVQSRRDDEDLDRQFSRENEDDEIASQRSDEDDATAQVRSDEDESQQEAWDREDAKDEKENSQIVSKRESLREKEDGKTDKDREKEDSRIEKTRDREKDTLERQQSKEIDKLNKQQSKEDDRLQDSWESRGLDSESQDRELSEMQTRHSREYDETTASHEKQTEDMERRWSTEDAVLEEARNAEDREIRTRRDAEDRDHDGKKNEAETAKREARQREMQEKARVRQTEDAERDTRRESEDRGRQAKRASEDAERVTSRRSEDESRTTARRNEDESRVAVRRNEDESRVAVRRNEDTTTRSARDDEDRQRMTRRGDEDRETITRRQREDRERGKRAI